MSRAGNQGTWCGRLVLHVGTFLVFIASQGRAQGIAPVWVDDPYRNFVGDWSGTVESVKDKVPLDLRLTIVEERDKARMRWDYVFGTKGKKGFDRQTKYVVMAPKLAKLMMHYEGSDEELFDAPGLNDFARKGSGRFTACYEIDTRTYFHLKKHVIEEVTFDLQAETLTYVREATREGKKNVMNNVTVSRVHRLGD